MSVRDPLRAAARHRPSAPALDDGGRRLTYGELDRRADEVAARLAELGGGRGRHLALVLTRSRAAVILLHGAPRAGLVAAPLSPRLTSAELSRAVDALGPVAVVCDRRTVDGVSDADPGAPILLADPEGPEGSAAVGDGPPAPSGAALLSDLEPASDLPGPPPPGEVRYVLWTSGTSGSPRGVHLTGRNVEASARASEERLGLGPDDRWLGSLSPAHVGGLALITRAAILGASVVLRGRFDEAELSRLAEEGAVSHASLVPLMLRRLLDHRGDRPAPEALRCLLIGGARAPEPLVRAALDRGYPVALTYGMTETTSQVATAGPDRVRRKPGAVGRPLSCVRVRIGDDGEIRVKGETLAAGYAGGEPLDLDPDGWFRTGDLGRLDEEGDLRVTGRRSDRIVSGGVTVDAHEVEDVLRSVPGVTDAAVVGLPDPEWGERVAALVVPEEPERTSPGRLEEEARARLSGPKRPRTVRLAAAVPRTRTGKIDRARVRELLGADRPPPGRA